jgi:hypothetical protein
MQYLLHGWRAGLTGATTWLARPPAAVLLVFLLYAGVSIALFGRGVVGSLDSTVVGDTGADKTLYMWSLEWWPYALLHGRNPLDVDVAWAPHGFDLGLGTAGGGLALLAAPLTSILGPVATYNILILAAPALAATTAYLLVRHITGRIAPSLMGGYVFGFSSYELGRLLGHLPLAFIALVPLVFYLVLLRRDGKLSRRAFVPLLAAVLVAQFLILPQIFFSLLVVGAVSAASAVAVLGLRTVRRSLAETAVALLVTLAVVSPIIAYAFVSDAEPPARSPFAGSADVLNFVVPTRRTWLRPPGAEEITDRFTGSGTEHGAYLGLPLLALAVLGAVRRPSSRARWLIVAVLVAAVALSLGTRVKVAGEVIGIGPWAAMAPLPIVGSALPIRLTMYTALLAGLLIALALADRRSIARWLLAVAGIVATLPNLQLAQWSSDVSRPQFLGEGRYERHIPEGSIALVLPYGPAGWSMLWQAEADFKFRIVGGHFGLRVTPPEEEWRDVYEQLGTGSVPPDRLRSFLLAHDVDVVVVAPGTRGRARRAVEAAMGSPPEHVLDVLVYRV